MTIDLLARCVSAGLKMTEQRRVILRVLEEAEDHPSVEAVYDRARKVDSSVSMATVYRTLGLLDELGLVVRHDFKENFSRYEVRDGEHNHLIDLDTGSVLEFHDAELEKAIRDVASKMGYELSEQRLELYGRRRADS